MITTEAVFTSPMGFGIAKATPAGRAIARIIDGRPLGTLRDQPEVVQLVGGIDPLDALRSESGELPVELCILASIRSGKTILALSAGIVASQRVDVSGLTHGEVPRVSIVSLKLDTAAAAFRMLTGAIQASPVLRALLIGEPTADSLMLRHPSGRPIEIACVAGSKAGAGLVARWSAGYIADEAPRMSGSQDGAVVNLDDQRTAVLGRLLPGAQALYIGSAWAPAGTVYDMVEEHFGKPGAPIVVLRGTGPMLNPTWWTPARCQALRERDEVAFQTDVMGEFADPETGLLSPVSIRMHTRAEPLELRPEGGGWYVWAVDPSEGGFGNGFSLVGIRIDAAPVAEGDVRLKVAVAREWRNAPLERIWSEIARGIGRYGCNTVVTDQYAAAANTALAARYGVRLVADKSSATTNLEDYTNLATLLHTGRLELAPHKLLVGDLLGIRKRTTQTGYSIVLPRTADNRHGDLASALCKATKFARLVPQIESSRRRYDDPRLRAFLSGDRTNELFPLSGGRHY